MIEVTRVKIEVIELAIIEFIGTHKQEKSPSIRHLMGGG
jgi:hypothetical protein